MIIKTEALTKHYQVGSEKVEALKGITFSVERGEFISRYTNKWNIFFKQ